MMVYKIEFYAYLPKISIYFFLYFELRSDPDPDFLSSAKTDPDPGKKSRILIPVFTVNKLLRALQNHRFIKLHLNNFLSNQKKKVGIFSI